MSPLRAPNSPSRCSTHALGVNVHLALGASGTGIRFTRRHCLGPEAGSGWDTEGIRVGCGRPRAGAPAVPARAEGAPARPPLQRPLATAWARLPSNRPAPGLLIRRPAPAGRRIPIGCGENSGSDWLRRRKEEAGRPGGARAERNGRGGVGGPQDSLGAWCGGIRRSDVGMRVGRRRRRSGTRCGREHGGRGLGFRRAGRTGPGREGGGGESVTFSAVRGRGSRGS